MQSNELNMKLMALWKEIFSCQKCNLPDGYVPQFRPVGPRYKKGGAVFAQINPGHIGSMTVDKINAKYKTDKNRKRALEKQKSTFALIEAQMAFMENPSLDSWDSLIKQYLHAMQYVWGWPQGKYYQTIEKHGVDFDDVAIINLAQCPIPNDQYSKSNLSNCWSLQTKKLLSLLGPKVIVAQGKTAYQFLINQQLGIDAVIVEGNHHASRQSNDIKNQLFRHVKQVIAGNVK